MENYSALLARRSVRRYKETPVAIETLKELVRAGMYAPSPFATQPWEFVIITDPDVLKAMAKATPFWRMLKRCPAAIVVLAKLQENRYVTDDLFYFQACSAATENIVIAAQGNGLSSVWLGLYPTQDRMDVVRDALKLPDDVIPFSVLPIGEAYEEIEPHDFFDEEKVHYNHY